MKKIGYLIVSLVVLLLVSLLTLTGCNKQLIDLKLEFKYAYFIQTDTYVEIEKWKDYEDGEQIQLTLPDGNILLTSSYNVILMKNKTDGFKTDGEKEPDG